MITDVNDLEKIIRAQLITQSQLNSKFVKNALSIYGSPLNKSTNTDIFQTISTSDSLIIFELYPIENSNNVSETEELSGTEELMIYSSFRVHVMIYGDSSRTLGLKLIARLRTQAIRSSLHEQDVHLIEVSGITPTQEYKNNVMWLRADFNIDIAVQMKITQVTGDVYFLDYASINTATESSGTIEKIY